MRTVPAGERIPAGLSKYTDRTDSGYQLRLPIFIWWKVSHDILCDVKRPGWWALNILLKTEFHGFKFRWGWVLVKQTGPEQRYGVEA